MSNPIVTALLEVLPQFEGLYTHMYLDGPGNVTCAIGHLIPNVEAALQLPWKFDNDEDATETSVRAEWARVTGMEAGHTAGFYGKECLCEVSKEWALQDCEARLTNEYLPATERIFNGYGCYPVCVQAALLDMCYNLGASGLEKYHKLIGWCGGRNWTEAAKECHRGGINKERNEWTKNQFLAAAKLV